MTIGDAVSSAALALLNSDQIRDTSVVSFNAGLAGDSATLALNGYNQTVAGIQTISPAGSESVIEDVDGNTPPAGPNTPAVLTVNDSASFIYDGIICDNPDAQTGKLSLVKQGAGTLTLRATFAYTGTITISAGTSDQISYSGPTTISGGTLVLDNLTYLASSITDNATLIFNQTAYQMGTASPISGSGNVIKTGVGNLAFGGSTANTYQGTTTVLAGTLTLAKAAGVTSVPGALTIGDGTGGTNSAVVQLESNNQIAATSAVTVTASGFLDLTGSSSLQTTPGSGASAISLDFQGGGPNGTPAVMGPTEVAGVYATDQWNTGIGASNTTGLALNNNTGAATTASAVWDAFLTTWSTGITDSPGNNRMMDGYLDPEGAVGTVTISGLPAAFTSGGYSVYVYYDGDLQTDPRVGQYTIGGTTLFAQDKPNSNFKGTFTQVPDTSLVNLTTSTPSGNYLVFNNLSGASFTLEASGVYAQDYYRSPINGIQIVANNGATTVGTISQTIASLSGNGNVGLGKGTLTTGDGTSTEFDGVLSGPGGLTKAGTGTFTLGGPNTYAGATKISAGSLQIGAGGTTGSLGSGAVTDNAALTFDLSSAVTVANVITGTGTLTQSGTGTLTLSGANTYTGGTTISAGTLQIGAGGTTGSLGSGAVTDNAALTFDLSSAVTVANLITGTGTLTQSGTGTLTLSAQDLHRRHFHFRWNTRRQWLYHQHRHRHEQRHTDRQRHDHR